MLDDEETPAERRFRRETNAVYVFAAFAFFLPFTLVIVPLTARARFHWAEPTLRAYALDVRAGRASATPVDVPYHLASIERATVDARGNVYLWTFSSDVLGDEGFVLSADETEPPPPELDVGIGGRIEGNWWAF